MHTAPKTPHHQIITSTDELQLRELHSFSAGKPRKLHANGHVNHLVQVLDLSTSTSTTGTSATALSKQQRACEQPCPNLAVSTSTSTTGTLTTWQRAATANKPQFSALPLHAPVDHNNGHPCPRTGQTHRDLRLRNLHSFLLSQTKHCRSTNGHVGNLVQELDNPETATAGTPQFSAVSTRTTMGMSRATPRN